MKKVLIIVVSVLVVILIGVGIYMDPLLPIITGYAAKGLASGVFVSGRAQEDIENVDLNFSFIKYTKNKVNYKDKSVTSRFLWNKSTAVYQDGYGCTIVRDFDKDDILDRPVLSYKSDNQLNMNEPWPVGDRLSDYRPANVDYTVLDAAVEQAFGNEPPHNGTRALIVIHDDQIIAEKYAEGYDATTRLLSWSMGKSITNALIGILVKEGKIDINEPMLMPGWEQDERKLITWNDIMHMSSGLEWEEDYGNESDVNVMLHKVGDFGTYAADKPAVAKPNTVWNYSSGSTNIACLKLKDYFDTDADYYNFPYEKLFRPINMRSVVFETDAAGTFVGSSYVYATARDFARFGLLYLNNGYWQGKQILPDGWVDYSSAPADASGGEYAAFFWSNASQELPDAPEDMYSCEGHDGQMIYIIPSLDVCIVRLGYSKSGTFDFNLMLKDILEAFPE
jgi:CubicO group peptidase (beta-lactamase class C family)